MAGVKATNEKYRNSRKLFQKPVPEPASANKHLAQGSASRSLRDGSPRAFICYFNSAPYILRTG